MRNFITIPLLQFLICASENASENDSRNTLTMRTLQEVTNIALDKNKIVEKWLAENEKESKIHFQQTSSGEVGVLEKLSYVDVNSRLKVMSTLNQLLQSANATLNNTFTKNSFFFDKVNYAYVGKLSNIGRIDQEMQKCIYEIDKVYKEAPFNYDKSKLELQHSYEKEHIYRKLFVDIYEETRKKAEMISSQTVKFGIANDCEHEPECRARIEGRINEIDAQYGSLIETTKVLFMEQESEYRNRVQDYRIILEKAMTPYNLLADHCLQKHLRNVDNFHDNLIV